MIILVYFSVLSSLCIFWNTGRVKVSTSWWLHWKRKGAGLNTQNSESDLDVLDLLCIHQHNYMFFDFNCHFCTTPRLRLSKTQYKSTPNSLLKTTRLTSYDTKSSQQQLNVPKAIQSQRFSGTKLCFDQAVSSIK